MSLPKLTLTIEKINSSGNGVARVDGKVYFVPQTVPGDVVEVQVEKEHARYAEAKMIRIVESSPDRIVPECPYYAECGGCDLQHMTYEAQLRCKKEIVVDALRKIAGVDKGCISAVLPSPKMWHYRNRVKLHRDPNGIIGFYKPKTHQIVAINRCLIADEVINEQLKPGNREKFFPKHVYSGSLAGEVEVRSDQSQTFSQVNPSQNENLIRLVLDFLGENEKVFDLYCGNGNLTFPIAKKSRKVWGIEISQEAIAEAQKVAEKNKVGNVSFSTGSVLPVLSEMKDRGISCDAIVVDPPRKGMEDAVKGVLAFKPKKIVYVSCDPATFARDAQVLIKGSYDLVKCQPLDMFPQTAHVEVVGLFRLK